MTPQDFEVSSSLIDSNTNAVLVANVGSSEFEVNSSSKGFSLSFQEKKRIKLLNKNGFDAATIEIPLYVDGKNAEKLENLVCAFCQNSALHEFGDCFCTS